MTYIIAEPCINVKDRACVDVCPVDCIYEAEDQLYIHPDECIDCGACEPECPVTAIFPEEDTPPQWKSYIAKNRDVFQGATPPGKPSPERGAR
jgi:ferredoxin